MWHKIRQFICFRNGKNSGADQPDPNAEIFSELGDIKKILRKQGIAQELFKKEILESISENTAQFSLSDTDREDINLLTEFVDSFFYLDKSIRNTADLSSSYVDTTEIVWQKLEELLESMEIEIINPVEEPFDPRSHEAVEALGSGQGESLAYETVQPGYRYRGCLIRPARVIVRTDDIDMREEG